MPEETKESSTRRPLFIVGGIVAALVLLGGGLYFGARQFLETSQATVAAMPTDTAAYVGFDFVSLLQPSAVRTLGRLSGDESAETDADVYTQVEDSFLADYGVSIEEDIQPWIGRSIGFGVQAFDAADFMPTDYILAAEVRDRGEADAFLERFSAENEITTGETDGNAYVVIDGEYALGRVDSLMLLTANESSFAAAVAALNSENFSSAAGYESVTAKLPSDRSLTMLISATFFEGVQDAVEAMEAQSGLTLTDSVAGTFDNPVFQAQQMSGMSLSITANGLEFDFASQVDESMLTETQLSLQNNAQLPSNSMASLAPENSFIYLSSGGLGTAWEVQKEVIEQTNENFADSLKLAEEQLGFSLDNDLMPQLSAGDFGLFLFESSEGLIPTFAELNVGFVMAHQVADESKMESIVDSLADSLVATGVMVTGEDGLRELDFLGSPAGVMGVQNGMFMLGTDVAAVDQLGTTELSNNAQFAQAQSAFPDDMELIMWMDLERMLTLFEADAEVLDRVGQIPMVAVGGSTDNRGRMIVFVEE